MADLIAMAGDHGTENHQEWNDLVSEFNKNFIEFPEHAHALASKRTVAGSKVSFS
jgi:hypothetical protein